jgi:dTDP-4-dehydrorhamnose 3,5-epimerase
MPFSFEKTFLDGLILITPKVFVDDRGFFLESYKKSDFSEIGIKEEFIQDNHSRSAKGALRELHFQKKQNA